MIEIRKTILPKQISRRAYSIFFIFIIGYLVLVYKVVDIQFINADFYKEKVENQNTRKIELNSGRGTIYDRNNKALTDTKVSKIIVVQNRTIVKGALSVDRCPPEISFASDMLWGAPQIDV